VRDSEAGPSTSAEPPRAAAFSSWASDDEDDEPARAPPPAEPPRAAAFSSWASDDEDDEPAPPPPPLAKRPQKERRVSQRV
jgi:hypothetical protein